MVPGLLPNLQTFTLLAMQIVLASSSRYRQAQLTAFGIPFVARAPAVDEDELKARGPKDLQELTRFLALEKARSLPLGPDDVIIGSDQLVEFEGRRLDKPGTAAAACAQLRLLSGQTHRLITSIAVLRRERTQMATEITRVTLRALDQETIAAYVALDQPLDCAGSYKIERAGLGLIEKVDGGDPSAIQGLPLIHLTRCLLELGISPARLWSPP